MWHFYVLCYLINLVSQRDYVAVWIMIACYRGSVSRSATRKMVNEKLKYARRGSTALLFFSLAFFRAALQMTERM